MNEKLDETTLILTKRQRKEARRAQKEEERRHQRRRQIIYRLLSWLALTAVIITIVTGIVWKTGRTGTGSSTPETSQAVNLEISGSDHIIGNQNAKVVVMEYADFQCPACAVYHQTVRQAAADLGDKVKFVFRNFPLRTIHTNADLAARVAEAAGQQNNFWEMVDLLYKRQSDWSNTDNVQDIFIGYARELKLNEGQFQSDLNSSQIKSKVDSDYQSALRLGLNSTPSFFINGQPLSNLRGPDNLRQAIEQYLAANP